MKSLRILLTFILIVFISCNQLNELQLIELKDLLIECQVSKWCKGKNSNCKHGKRINWIIEKLDSDCAHLIFNDTTAFEDSVLIVRRNGFLKYEEIYLDFAKSSRQLEIWNYVNASDSRKKINDRVYLRTVGFD